MIQSSSARPRGFIILESSLSLENPKSYLRDTFMLRVSVAGTLGNKLIELKHSNSLVFQGTFFFSSFSLSLFFQLCFIIKRSLGLIASGRLCQPLFWRGLVFQKRTCLVLHALVQESDNHVLKSDACHLNYEYRIQPAKGPLKWIYESERMLSILINSEVLMNWTQVIVWLDHIWKSAYKL